MKKLAVILALVAITIGAFAQAPAKRSIASVDQEDQKVEIFAYDHADGTRGYYVGLHGEAFVLLGSNVNDAVTSLKQLYALFDAPVGDSRKYTMLGGTSQKLSEEAGTATVVVVKKNKKVLAVNYQLDGKKKAATIQKATAKNLLKFLTGYQKRHPDR